MLKVLALLLCTGLCGVALAQTPSPDFADDFSNPSRRWFSGRDDNYEMGYREGAYLMNLKVPDQVLYSWLPGRYRDTRVEVDATKLDSPNDGDIGIFCRFNGNMKEPSYYVFTFDPDDLAVAIHRADKGEFTRLAAGDIPRAATLGGMGRPNRLRADCSGNSLVMYVNGTEVLRAQDGTYEIGTLGLILYSYNMTFGVSFDNFALWHGGQAQSLVPEPDTRP